MTATNLSTTAGLSSASFRPRVGAVVIVGWTGEGSGTTPSAVDVADSLGEITFTAWPQDIYSPFGFAMGKAWYGIATTTTQRQVTVTVTGASTANNQLVIDEIDCTAVLHTAGINDNFKTNASASFASTPASTSYVYSMFLELAAQSATKPVSETAIVTNYQGGGTTTISSAADQAGSAPQAVAWTSAGGSYFLVRALEVSPPPPPPPPTTWNVGHIPLG